MKIRVNLLFLRQNKNTRETVWAFCLSLTRILSPMRLLLILLFPLHVFAQHFEGVIHYRIIIQGEDMHFVEQLGNIYGDEELYTINSKGDYKRQTRYLGETIADFIYHNHNNTLYHETKDDLFTTVTTCDKFADSLFAYELLPEPFSYLGYRCESVKFSSEYDSSIHLFSSEIQTDPALFSQHRHRNLDKKMQAMKGGLPLMSITNYGDYQVIREAVKVEKQPVTDDHFVIKNKEFVYNTCDQLAEPVGGFRVFYTKVAAALEYPKEARQNRIQGKVFVEFIVNKEGKISAVKVIKGLGAGCDEEVVRIMEETNVPWSPALRNGEKVNIRMVLPISFKLD